MATTTQTEAAPAAPRSYSIKGGLSKRNSRILAAAVIVAAFLLPFAFDPGSGFIADCVLALTFVIMALGLNIVVGFAGLLDLGYVAFFAFGAYSVGWFGSSFFSSLDIHILVSGQAELLPGIHLNFLLLVVVAMIICAIAGVLIGLPTLRLRGDYIAIVTLAFGEIIYRFAILGDSISLGNGETLTAGRQGITPVDPVKVPFVDQFSRLLDLRPWYWMSLIFVLIIIFVVIRLRDSRLGRAWIAIREDEVAAVSMGIPAVRTKLAAYAVGASFAGVAGATRASFSNTVNADQFAFQFSIFVLAMVILGGLGSIWGVVVGAILLSFINYTLIPDVLVDVPSSLGLDFQMTEVSFAIFGFLLLIVMVVRPQGLLPEGRRKLELTGAANAEPGQVGDDQQKTYEVRA